jgi:4-amino-4-deoxy-L-arabinose transferase-like glycosyltransferase
MMNDGPLFLELSDHLAARDWYAALHHAYHPLYSALAAALRPLAGDPVRAAVAVSCLAGGVAVLALHDFLRRAFDPRTAFVGAALLAVQRYAIEFSGDVQSDGLYLALLLVGVALLWRALESGRVALALAAGLAAGLAYLTRPEGLGLVVAGGGVLAARALRREIPALRAAGLALALSLGAALCVAPYAAGLRWARGEWTLTPKKTPAEIFGVAELETDADVVAAAAAAAPSEPPGGAGEPSQPSSAEPSEPEARQPSFAHRIAAALWTVARPARAALGYDVALFLLVGVASLRGRPGARGELVGAIAVVYGTVLLALAWNAGYVDRRHALPPLVPAFGYAAIGLVRVGGWLAGGAASIARRLRLAPLGFTPGAASATVLGLGLAGVVGLGGALQPDRLDELAARRAAEWLRAHRSGAGSPAGSVAANKRRTAYYAGAPFFELAVVPDADAFTALRDAGVSHLVLERGKRPALEAEAQAVGMLPIHRESAAGREVLVFEIAPGARGGDS